MKLQNKFIPILTLCLLAAQALGQTNLSMQQAFELAMQNNYSIQIARNEFDISKRNNVIGNAGMLPSIAGTINQDNQVLDTKQKFLSGAENNKTGAKSNQLNAGIELSWTLFNGMKMFATKNRLAELEAIGEKRLRQQMETTLSRVAKSYLDVVLLKDQLKSGKEFISISEKRLDVAKAKVLAGKSPKSEVLNAMVNLNSDIAAYKRLETQLKNSKLSLVQQLGMPINYAFDVSDSLTPEAKVSLDDLKSLATQNNTGIQMAKLNQEIAMNQLREVRAERYPSLQFKSGYTIGQQQSQAGFLQSSNTNGFHYGAGLNLNIFNGFDVNRRATNARIMFKSSDLLLKDSLLKLEVVLTQAYYVYLTNIDLFQFEQSNLDVARQNFEISRDQNDQGMISNNDLRIAQVNYLQAVNRLLVAAYDSKISEIELKRLSGTLVK